MDDVAKQRVCAWCDEPITDDTRYGDMNPLISQHPECLFRSIMGSVAHIERRCGCYVPGADEADPPGMTRREAARAACEAWKKQGHTFPSE